MRVLSFKHLVFGSFVESSGTSQTVFVFLLIPYCLTLDVRAPPVLPNVPLLWAWNAPTEDCIGKYNEPLDMSLYSLIGSPRKGVTGQGVTLFYTDRLGYYPHIDSRGTVVHGGIPQSGNLQQHLTKARDDILNHMPADKVGLAVIDWEDWRPTWARNWSPKDNYKNMSIDLVWQQNPQLSVAEATRRAQADFERAGKDFMIETLRLGRSTRPQHLWGYYLFPDCYNHNYGSPTYDGKCPPMEKQRNDGLAWMWNESTALYPSIYLKSTLRSSQKAAFFVRNRVQEAIRVSRVRNPQSPLPVFVYVRLVFTDLTLEFLSQDDLVHTIGETVALGASGIVIWGALTLARRKSCPSLHNYMETTLNPYIINVTLAAKMCNQALCQDQGVCTRKDWDSNDYLHLDPMNFAIQLMPGGKFVVHGNPTVEYLRYFSKKFQCSCFANLNCTERLHMEKVHTVNVCAAQDVCINAFVDPQVEPSLNDVCDPHGTPSATVSPHVLRKGLSGWLFFICICIHRI